MNFYIYTLYINIINKVRVFFIYVILYISLCTFPLKQVMGKWESGNLLSLCFDTIHSYYQCKLADFYRQRLKDLRFIFA